jgi:hypothetical protein
MQADHCDRRALNRWCSLYTTFSRATFVPFDDGEA